MARTVAELPPGPRISDFISLGVSAKAFPAASVEAALARIGSPIFTRCAWCAAKSPPGTLFPPRRRTALHSAVLEEILEQRVDPRRNRHNPRAVKRKIGKFPIRPWGVKSKPLIDIQEAIGIVK